MTIALHKGEHMKRLAPLWRLLRLFYDAYWRFADDDGWAIASHVALTFLTSMFPFLIFITALAGLFSAPRNWPTKHPHIVADLARASRPGLSRRRSSMC